MAIARQAREWLLAIIADEWMIAMHKNYIYLKGVNDIKHKLQTWKISFVIFENDMDSCNNENFYVTWFWIYI